MTRFCREAIKRPMFPFVLLPQDTERQVKLIQESVKNKEKSEKKRIKKQVHSPSSDMSCFACELV